MTDVLHHASRYGRDVCMAAAGIILLGNAAPSVEHLGGGDLFAIAWASFIAIGSITSIVAGLLHRPGVEVIAQLWVAVGFLVWAVSALSQPHVDAVSVAVALVFGSIASGCLYRAEMIAGRRVNR